MTFGSTCSPACAQVVKNYNAEQFISTKPLAANAVVKQHYADGYIDSFDTRTQAVKTIKDVIEIHQQAGFFIRNFVSNKSLISHSDLQTRKSGESCRTLGNLALDRITT